MQWHSGSCGVCVSVCVCGESAEERSIGVALFHMTGLCFRNQLCCNSTA